MIPRQKMHTYVCTYVHTRRTTKPTVVSEYFYLLCKLLLFAWIEFVDTMKRNSIRPCWYDMHIHTHQYTFEPRNYYINYYSHIILLVTIATNDVVVWLPMKKTGTLAIKKKLVVDMVLKNFSRLISYYSKKF